MPQQAIESDVKGVVQLLAASANANFADKIAKALLRAGYRLDPGEFDPARIDAVVVLWTGVALDKPGLIDVAREAIAAGEEYEGPLIVEQLDTTTVLPPNCVANADASGNLIITVNAQ